MSNFDELAEQLQEMTGIPAPSGYEEPMIRYMVNKMKSFGLKPEVDISGNVITRLGKSSGKPKIMILAHMDELGLIVRKIEKEGFIRVEIMGGVPVVELPGTKVLIRTRKGDFIEGYFGYKSFHLIPVEERLNPVPLDKLYIDIGCSNRKEVLDLGIEAGCPIIYSKDFIKRGSIVFAPAIDNRGGCLILLKLIEKLHGKSFNPEVFIVASVLEEYNLKGVIPAARNLNPDIAICLDATIATDTPELDNKLDIKLGCGPVISTFNWNVRTALSGVIPNPKLLELVEGSCMKAGVNVQKGTLSGGSTDLSWIKEENKGILCIDLAFPGRYMHSSMQACNLGDIDQLIKVVETLVLSIPSEVDFSRI